MASETTGEGTGRGLDRCIAAARSWTRIGDWVADRPETDGWVVDESDIFAMSPDGDIEPIGHWSSSWMAAGDLWAEMVAAGLQVPLVTGTATNRVYIETAWHFGIIRADVIDGNWQAAAANAIAQAWLAAHGAGLLGQGEANNG